ncbi:MFS transporter [Natranaerofaba carboxydovora]|uniref:MFS transporter n=1 Tax=Natranaerofaba carboxydovora TaxID=2742683 RepID=UPI001F141882|nr:MFS transporter [Natranaerofaba carboxydovora]UMZ74601.1 Riboflavin transporter RibZ [Natranaerofaba carboxydovora]
MTNKNFLLLLGAALLTFINFFATLVTAPIHVIELGGNEFYAGLQNTVFFIAAVLLRFYFGPMADSRGRKVPLLIGIFAFATAPLLFMISNSVFSLIMARVYQAVGLAAYFSAGTSLTADISPPDKRGSYLGMYRLVNTLALLLGPAIAMQLKDAYNFDAWFIVSFGIGVAAFILGTMITPPAFEAQKTSGIKEEVEKNIKVLRDKNLWPIYIATSLGAFSHGVIFTFSSIYVSQVMNMDNPAIYFTFFGVFGIFANLAAGYLSDIFGRARVVWPCLISAGIGVGIYVILPLSSLVFYLSSFFVGFGFSGAITAIAAWLVDRSQDKTRATALSFFESTIDMSIAISSFIFGGILGIIGFPLSFMLFGLLIVLASLVMFRFTLMGRF